ncbi:TPA: LOW QUALITY PROTEIN: hypothetical protein N0F65_006948 [Lagenidium giganteum]|uniref:Transmembrane protein 231 n=1 Tax=Lagenidium giganteum TaxID=4803 RepID=A0AAV2ZBW9_9STRA|nr:TPA: LOW QUALITY PROTEIN: hypothetical protein N0F65_006948 [Lagenidium giganteum]
MAAGSASAAVMAVVCYRAPVERVYYSHGALALPSLVSLALHVLVVLLPFFLAHGSRGMMTDFWTRTNTYLEHPRVHLTYDVLFLLEGRTTTDALSPMPLTIVHTTFPPHVQRLLDGKLRAGQISMSADDSDQDGRPEALHVQASVPLAAGEEVFQVFALVLLNYTANSYIKVEMDAAAIVTFSSPLPGKSLFVDGDLKLNQRTPFHVKASSVDLWLTNPFASEPILDFDKVRTVQDLNLESIIARYRGRNQVLKKAWMQYYCIMIIVLTIANQLRTILFKNKVNKAMALDTATRISDGQLLTRKDL